MKNLVQSIIGIVLFGLMAFPVQAAFDSIYVFGDSLSATADNPAPAPAQYFYGQRDSNGRVWVEVLAQRQGLTPNNINNDSYYDHNSAEVVTDVKNFTATSDVANDLFIVWVCNADTFDAASYHDTPAQWTAAINQSQANHLQIINSLYAKGVRNLVMPNAVDISEIPAYNESNLTNVMHNGCIAYNVAFSNTISQALASCPGLAIYTPDYYTLLNNVLTNAAAYGLTNALSQGSNGKFYSIDAFSDDSIQNLTLDGQGTNYIFWDPENPTAMLHEIMADVAQQLISPVQINWLALFNGTNRLDVANVPVGLNGFVDGCTATNQVQPGWTWTTVTNINSTNTTQSIFVYAPLLPPASPAGGSGGSGSTDPNNTNNVNGTYIAPFSPAQFYRLHFPYAWSWP